MYRLNNVVMLSTWKVLVLCCEGEFDSVRSCGTLPLSFVLYLERAELCMAKQHEGDICARFVGV
jgi:hypothetical protein